METRLRPDTMSGFTLIELMFALTVASILLVVAVPAFRSVTANNRLTTQANDVVAAINLARSEAIKRNTTITFCRADAEDDDECAGEGGQEWAFWLVHNPAGDVLRRGAINNFGGSMTIVSSLTDDEATFGADGLTRTGGALANDDEITLCSTVMPEGNLRRIVMGAGSRLATQVDSDEGCAL